MQLTLTVWQIIAVSLIPLALLAQIWAVKNWRRLGDYYNLLTRRHKCISVRYHPLQGGVRERIVVPDSDGIFSLYGGSHAYDAKYSVWNTRKGLHEADFFEGRIPNAEMVLRRERGTTYAIPQPRTQESVFTSSEFGSLVRAHIVQAISVATSREMRQLTLMYYLMFGTLFAVIVSMGFTWWLIGGLKDDLGEYLRVLLNR